MHLQLSENRLTPNHYQRDPVEIVRKLARSLSCIELFVKVVPKNCVQNFTDYKEVLASREGLDYNHVIDWSHKHPLLQQTEWSDVPDDIEWEVPGLPAPEARPQEITLPLTEGETYRIKRALLRYEIFCALFYLSPNKIDARSGPHRFNHVTSYSRRRTFLREQAIFLKDYVNPWEIGELAVIANVMFDLVRYADSEIFLQHVTLGFESRNAFELLLCRSTYLDCTSPCR